MVYDKVWQGMAWYVKSASVNFFFYGIALGYAPVTCGEADVKWSCSHIQDPFTSRGTIACMFRSHVQLLFTLGCESKLRISLFWDRILDSQLLCAKHRPSFL